MPFREAPSDFPPADGEELAVKELATRAARLRRVILLPTILAGVFAGIAGYLLVREIQFSMWNAQIPWLSGALGVFPPFAGALRLARYLSDAAVARRAPEWISEQAARHKIEASILEQYRSVL